MKKHLFSIIISLFLVASAFAQTGITNYNHDNQNGLYVVRVEYDAQTTDSTSTITTKQFALPQYTDFSNFPATFLLKFTGTTGTPNSLVTLNGVYGSHSVEIDTLRAHAAAQGQVDSTGTLNLNGLVAPAYTISFTNTGNALATGFVEIVFRRQVTGYIPNYQIIK